VSGPKTPLLSSAMAAGKITRTVYDYEHRRPDGTFVKFGDVGEEVGIEAYLFAHPCEEEW